MQICLMPQPCILRNGTFYVMYILPQLKKLVKLQACGFWGWGIKISVLNMEQLFFLTRPFLSAAHKGV